jgi:AmmeMemoRadiSam system protein B/AmmeMemoRadiSam system protein A
LVSFGFLKDKPQPVRRPAVAGLFYPGDVQELTLTVDELLSKVAPRRIDGRVLAMISPHAGYPYSGHVAAQGYATLRQQQPQRIVLIAPSHVEAFSGASVFGGRAYATPLGEVVVDRPFCERLVQAGGARFSDSGHGWTVPGRGEHALEVQLPFLQRVLDSMEIVPIVLGDKNMTTCRRLGSTLADLMDPDTVIVASSDLSHYHSYEAAQVLDRRVSEFLLSWDYFSLYGSLEAGECEACGSGPIIATMIAAQQSGGDSVTLLHAANSGDVPPFRREEVVGYLSAVLTRGGQETGPPATRLSDEEGKRLLEIAQESVRRAVTGEDPMDTSGEAPSLRVPRASFVTLRREGRLRGCIGSVVAREPLATSVATAAAAAALRDPRFAPVSVGELAGIDCHISVLTPFRLLRDPSKVEVGHHGLLVELNARRGLLLPQVAAEQGWNAEIFLEQTCLKAGLEPTAWQDPRAAVYAFTAQLIGE